jgi:hypothetical protein
MLVYFTYKYTKKQGFKGLVFHLLITCHDAGGPDPLKRHDRRRYRAAVVSGAARRLIGHRYPEHATPASK